MPYTTPTAAESLLARAREEGRARLRVYIGAAPGVGKSYKMLEDAHELRRQGLDDAVKARRPQVVVVDELAHTNAPGSAHEKRYEDVLDLLDAGLNVITAVNIQHI